MRTKNRCACGLPLHYKTKEQEEATQKKIAEHGEFIPVHFGQDNYLVQRHYAELHGIPKGNELKSMMEKGIIRRG